MDLAHVPYVRDDRNPEFPGHQADRQKLADSAHADRIDLTDAQCLRLKIVFEDNPVGNMLARGQQGVSVGLGQGGVTENIVRVGGLLNPKQVQPERIKSRRSAVTAFPCEREPATL